MSAQKKLAARQGDVGRLEDGRKGPAIKASGNVLIHHRRALRAGDKGMDSHGGYARAWTAQTGAPAILINNRHAYRIHDVVQQGEELGKTISGGPTTQLGDFVSKQDPTLHPISIVLRDMPGPLGAPLANTPWILSCAGVEIDRGKTGIDGKVDVKEEVSRYHVYALEAAGHTTILMVMDIDSQPDAAQSAARLSALGYNPGLPTTITVELTSSMNLFEDDEDPHGVVIADDEERKKRLKEKAGF